MSVQHVAKKKVNRSVEWALAAQHLARSAKQVIFTKALIALAAGRKWVTCPLGTQCCSREVRILFCIQAHHHMVHWPEINNALNPGEQYAVVESGKVCALQSQRLISSILSERDLHTLPREVSQVHVPQYETLTVWNDRKAK